MTLRLSLSRGACPALGTGDCRLDIQPAFMFSKEEKEREMAMLTHSAGCIQIEIEGRLLLFFFTIGSDGISIH